MSIALTYNFSTQEELEAHVAAMQGIDAGGETETATEAGEAAKPAKGRGRGKKADEAKAATVAGFPSQPSAPAPLMTPAQVAAAATASAPASTAPDVPTIKAAITAYIGEEKDPLKCIDISKKLLEHFSGTPGVSLSGLTDPQRQALYDFVVAKTKERAAAAAAAPAAKAPVFDPLA